MTEEKSNALRQADINLRDAIRQDEAESPQMPANLNERLMQRVAKNQKKPRRVVIWPWIAAACAAGVMMIWLMPPKEEASPLIPLQEARGVVTPERHKMEEPQVAKVESEVVKPAAAQVKVRKRVQSHQETMNTPTMPTTQAAESTTDLAAVETVKSEEKSVTLTERDIPITRPENYKYTPEELALMKKQANEAYLKWAQLELEIAKYNLEQTAQK